jgi:hypothetical protein
MFVLKSCGRALHGSRALVFAWCTAKDESPAPRLRTNIIAPWALLTGIKRVSNA